MLQSFSIFRTSKSSLFPYFYYSDVRYSDPHCILMSSKYWTFIVQNGWSGWKHSNVSSFYASSLVVSTVVSSVLFGRFPKVEFNDMRRKLYMVGTYSTVPKWAKRMPYWTFVIEAWTFNAIDWRSYSNSLFWDEFQATIVLRDHYTILCFIYTRVICYDQLVLIVWNTRETGDIY